MAQERDTVKEHHMMARIRDLENNVSELQEILFALGNISDASSAAQPLEAFAKLDGRPGGQRLYGGININEDLTLQGTKHSTSGDVVVASNFRVQGTGRAYIGTDDTVDGLVRIYGDATGSASGGCLQLMMAADYDTTYQNWAIEVSEDDLLIRSGLVPRARFRPTGELDIDTINELTSAAGVTVDTLLIKDGDISIFAKLAGRSGGQTLYGGTGLGENLTLDSTSNASKGSIILNSNVSIAASKSLKVDTVIEATAAAGVTIDGVVLKDGVVAVGDVAFDDATSDPTASSSVQAAADGTENSVARKDHVHPISHSIADNAVVTVDQADVAANDFAKFTASGLSGRSYEETLGDLSGQAGGAFDWNSQNLTSVGTIGSGAITSTGDVDSAGTVKADTIAEHTAATGVTIDGVTALDSFMQLTEIAAPANPAANKGRFYAKDVAGVTKPMWLDSAGTETDLTSGGAGGGASTALDNLAAVAINTSLISDTDSTDDLGSSTKYWRYGYIDKVYLNATATISGATAGRHTVVGGIGTDSCIAVKGAAYSDTKWINADAAAATLALGATAVEICPNTQTLSNDNTGFYGVSGNPSIYGQDGKTNLYVGALAFNVACGSLAADTTWSYARGVSCGVNFIIAGAGKTTTVTAAQGVYVQSPAVVKPAGSVAVGTLDGIHICNPGTDADMAGSCTTMRGLYIEDCTNATNNYMLELGSTGPFMRVLGSGSWSPAVNTAETPLYLYAGNNDNPLTKTLYQVKWVDGAAIGAGDKVMVLA